MDKVILVVTSKVKAHLKESGMKCSADVAVALTNRIETMCAEAVEAAKKEKRVTVKGRDFK